jgi:iron complex outermembrane receptor protein
MFTNNKIAKSVSIAIAFGAVSGLSLSGAAVAQQQEQAQADTKIEKIQVTGSRIRRTDLEGSVPVTIIDRAAIDLSGQISVSDLLRSTSFNSAGSFRPQSGSSAQGVSQINLRGLGAERSLILVDGRRLPKSPSTGNSQDLNTIPIAAVERIEILSDGASATYGSDAIAGVVNIILRKDFDGVELRLGASDVSTPKEGGDREAGSAVFGATSDKSSIIGGVSWNNRDIIFENAYEWVQPGASSFGVNWRTAAGFTSVIPDATCDSLENFFTLSSGLCAYNFNATNANEASTGNQSAFLKADYEINDDWKIFSQTLVTNTTSFGRYAPSLNNAGDAAFVGVDSINNPTNPASPFYNVANGEQREVNVRHRFAALGNRDNEVDNWSTDFFVGIEGDYNDMFIDLGVRKTKSKTYEIGRNYLMSSNARRALDSGDYLLNDPFGDRFTTTADRSAYKTLLNGLKVTTARIGTFDQEEVFGSVAFDVYDMGAGDIQAVVGFEYRNEDYSDTYDSLSEAGQVGGSAGNSAGGGRDVKGIYFETLIPVTDLIEVTFAGRYDEYSDYGSDFSPKISVKYDITDDLVLRASYGEGFRAPTLDILTQQPQPGNPSVSDDPSCINLGLEAGCDIQVNSLTIANPEIGSESSTQLSLGFAYQPTEWLNMSVDYYDIEIKNLIRFFGAQTILTREQRGEALPPGIGVSRLANGGIDLITQGYSNEGKLELNGIDLNFNTNFDLGDYGRVTQTLQISQQFDYIIDGGEDSLKKEGEPDKRGSLSTSYAIADFEFAWVANYISSQRKDGADTASWITHDMQATYIFSTGTSVAIGAQNIFEKDPQLNSFGGRNYNFDLYDAYGRIAYVRLIQRF